MKKYLFLVLAFVVMFAVPSFAQELAVPAAKVDLWDLILNNIGMVSSGIFALLTMVFGAKFAMVRNKFAQLLELLNEIQRATKDDKITKEEMAEIIKDAKALLGKVDKV